MDKINAVAIDGPAGSGKSTISRMVAKELAFTYIDTGAMYRALTLMAMEEEININDEKAIIALLDKFNLELLPSDDDTSTIKVVLNGKDVSKDIRDSSVTNNVKHVCKIREVREKLVEIQKQLAADSGGAVMEGRDIGTVVLKNAKYKFYMDASVEERAGRRYGELVAKGKVVDKAELTKEIEERDHSDKTREVGPLKQADDAMYFDTTGLSIDEVVNKMVSVIKQS